MPMRIAAVLTLLLTLSASLVAQQTRVIRPTGPPAWGVSVRLVEELRLGALEGAEEYTFGNVVDVAVAPDGRIYVADGTGPVVRSYDPRGRFLKTLGGVGSGPGEYRDVGGLRVFPDGRVALWDGGNGRITVFDSTGAYLAAHRVSTNLWAHRIFEVDHSGRMYVRTGIGRPVVGARSPDGWVRVSASGSVVDTIPAPMSPYPESFVLAGASGYERPFARELVSTMSARGYLLVGDNSRYAIELQHRDSPRVRIERSFRPVRLTAAERTEWEAWARHFERQLANPPKAPPGAVQRPPQRVNFVIPDTKPPFSELWGDVDGRIWVRRYVAAQQRPGPVRSAGDTRPRRVWREAPTYDILEPGGRLLATVTLPWNTYPYYASGNRLWATVRGEFDEEYIVRYRIEPARR